MPRSDVDEAALAAGLDRVFDDPGLRRAAGRRRGGRRSMDDRPHRRPGHRQDHHRRAPARPASPSSTRSRTGLPPRIAMCAPTAKAAARLQDATAAATAELPGGRPRAARAAPGHRRCTACSAGAGQQRPVPARRAPPAAARRRGRRRDVDGLAHAHGPAARGRASRRPTGAGRRRRPARLGRGRRGAGRPGRAGSRTIRRRRCRG